MNTLSLNLRHQRHPQFKVIFNCNLCFNNFPIVMMIRDILWGIGKVIKNSTTAYKNNATKA